MGSAKGRSAIQVQLGFEQGPRSRPAFLFTFTEEQQRGQAKDRPLVPTLKYSDPTPLHSRPNAAAGIYEMASGVETRWVLGRVFTRGARLRDGPYVRKL